MSLFSRVGAVWALACLCAPSLHAQSLKWISQDPVPVSTGDRAYLTRVNQDFQTFQEPGFEPLAVIPREDGAYVVVPANGGSTSTQLASMLNPSWQRQRGFQILRLDAQGQVLWQRMWTLRFSYNGFVGPQQLRLLDARLTPQGGLALLSDSAIYFDPEGAARHLSPRSPPPGCLPEGYATDQVQSFLAADASLVVNYDRFAAGGSRACAFAPDGSLIDAIVAAPDLALEALDFRAGVGFLAAHYVFDMGVYGQRTTRLRSGAQTLWSRIHAIDLRPQLAIAPDGSTWLREGSDLQVISADGQTLAQFSASQGAAPAAWLAGGDVLLADAGSLELRRVSSLGLERWSRPAVPQSGGDLTRWFVLGDQVRSVVHSSFSGRVLLPSFALADGALLSAPEFAPGALVIGPLAGADHLVGLPSAFSASWQRDPATCGTLCDPSALAVSPGLDLRVFDSASGALQAALDPGGFGFTTYARLRERGAGVVREFASENIAHARYVSTGAKELLEVSRLDPRGSEVWRTRLQFERFDVHNAVLTVVDGETYVAASALGPGATEHWLWKLDAAGAVAWTQALAEPFQQLMRLRVNNVPVACGLGQAQRPPLPSSTPVWQCFAGDGQRVVDTRLSYVLAANGWDVADAVPEGNGFRVRDLPPATAAPNLLYFSDLGTDGVRRFSFSWQFEGPAADEALRFDAIERGAPAFATALVVPAANPDARPKGLVLAAFDSMHQRLWQQRIDQELPSGDTRGVVSLVARDRSGQYVYVAFHPRLENLARPVRVCRFGALDGVAGPCVDTPFNARASALIAAAEGQMLLWAQPLQDGIFTGIGLYPLSDSGAGSPLFWSADHLAQSRDNTHSFFDTAWTVLEPRARINPAALGEGTSTAVVAVSLSVLFADGFE